MQKQLGLDTERFWEDVRRHEHSAHMADDVDSADASAVAGTPTFFVNSFAIGAPTTSPT